VRSKKARPPCRNLLHHDLKPNFLMNTSLTRRDFLKRASIVPGLAITGIGLAESLACAGEPINSSSGSGLKIGLNAYSFNKLLNDNIKERGPGITLLQVLDFCAKQKFEGLDATGYYFPGYPKVPPDKYIDDLKRKATDLGVTISGTGVRNNFTTSDKATRDVGVQHIKEYVEVAARLGAPVIRIFADTQMRSQTWETVAKGFTRNQVQDWISAAIRECADHGKKFKVRIGVQNHGDFLRTGQQLLDLVKAVGSDWCGPIVDTGYFKTDDPYAEMALVAPHAVNWQIKQSAFGQESDIPTDLVKLMRIIRKSGYHGFLPIEALSPKGKDFDPFTVVPEFQKKVQQALAETA
jgi:sugar phosphate isomerase/epimerase